MGGLGSIRYSLIQGYWSLWEPPPPNFEAYRFVYQSVPGSWTRFLDALSTVWETQLPLKKCSQTSYVGYVSQEAWTYESIEFVEHVWRRLRWGFGIVSSQNFDFPSLEPFKHVAHDVRRRMQDACSQGFRVYGFRVLGYVGFRV